MSNEVLKSIAVSQALYNIGYESEYYYILSYLLKFGTEDNELVDNTGNSFDLMNWCDSLSEVLTDKYGVGYPLFIVSSGVYEVLSTYYSTYDLNQLRLSTLDKLLDLQTEDKLLDYIDYNESIEDLKVVLKAVLKKLPVHRLNEVLKEYAVYNKCSKVEDFCFLYNQSVYIRYNIDSLEYTKADLNDLYDFIDIFADSLEYLEDYSLIFEDILNSQDIKLDWIE